MAEYEIKDGVCIIPEGTTEIKQYTLAGFLDMTGVTIPKSVKKIGGYAFYQCQGLVELDIPDSVTQIGECVCCECTALECINVGGNNTVYKSVDGVLYDKKMTSIICLPKHNKTTFIIAHRLSTVARADKIIVVKDGNVVEMGTHRELLSRNGYYLELYRSQFEV